VVGATMGAAYGCPDHGRHLLDLAAGHIAVLGQVVDNRIHADHTEVHLHDVDNGPPASHGRADAEAHNSVLCQGGINDPVGSILVVQVAGHAVSSAQDANILAHHDDLLIPGELLIQSKSDSLHICHIFRFHLLCSSRPQHSA